MAAIGILTGFIYLIGIIAFFYLCYNVYRLNKEQKKTVILLTKIYEQNGGKLTPYDRDMLEE